MLTPDATIQLNITPRLQARVILAGHLVDAVDRTYFYARFTTRATIRVNDRQNLWDHLAGLAGQGRCCHVTSSQIKTMEISQPAWIATKLTLSRKQRHTKNQAEPSDRAPP
jgi:hypothetical protein